MLLKIILKTIEKVFKSIVLLILAVNIFWGWSSYNYLQALGKFELQFLDVGQGDAILIKSPDNLYALIDGGRGTNVLQQLEAAMKLNHKNLELVVATHPDADHIEGIIPVLQQYDVKNFFWQKMAKQTDQYLELQDFVQSKRIRDYQLNDTDDFKLGCCVYFDTVWPLQGSDVYHADDANQISYAFVIKFMGKQMFLGGDLGLESEEAIVASKKYDIFIHKAGHHGSQTSSSLKFIKAINPEYTVISAGLDNTYGHPHQSVLTTLNHIDTQILRTDQRGRISFIFDRKGWQVITEK